MKKSIYILLFLACRYAYSQQMQAGTHVADYKDIAVVQGTVVYDNGAPVASAVVGIHQKRH